LLLVRVAVQVWMTDALAPGLDAARTATAVTAPQSSDTQNRWLRLRRCPPD